MDIVDIAALSTKSLSGRYALKLRFSPDCCENCKLNFSLPDPLQLLTNFTNILYLLLFTEGSFSMCSLCNSHLNFQEFPQDLIGAVCEVKSIARLR
jgi:hypothetical protein